MHEEIERSALRDRLRAWVRRNIIDQDPCDDESHSATRYSEQARFDSILRERERERSE